MSNSENRWILRIGAIATLLALAIDPFSQQLIQLEHTVKYVETTNKGLPSTPRATSYDQGYVFTTSKTNSTDESTDQEVLIMGAQPNISMQAAILNGLSPKYTADDEGPYRSCSTGNCTWGPFETLGVCTRCKDLTKELQQVKHLEGFLNSTQGSDISKENLDEINATALALPNGHFLLNPDGCYTPGNAIEGGCELPRDDADSVWVPGKLMTSYGTGDPNKTNSMQDLKNMIWSMSVIHLDDSERLSRMEREMSPEDEAEAEARLAGNVSPFDDPRAPLNNWPDSPALATECALYYCVASIDMAIKNNYVVQKISEVEDAVAKPDSWKPRDTSSLARENIPTNTDSLEFHERYAAVNMTDLVFHSPNTLEAQDYALTPETVKSAQDYTLTQEAVKSISAYFQETLRTSLWENETEALEMVREHIPDAKVLMNGRIESHNVQRPHALGGIWRHQRDKVHVRFNNLAKSMTNEMRNKGGEKLRKVTFIDTDLVESSYENPHYGRIGVSVTVYRSGFYWILLHATVLLFGVLFCVVTMRSSRRGALKGQPVWKNHSLAAVRQGAMLAQELEGLPNNLQELEGRAAKQRVVMLPNGKVHEKTQSEDSEGQERSSDAER